MQSLISKRVLTVVITLCVLFAVVQAWIQLQPEPPAPPIPTPPGKVISKPEHAVIGTSVEGRTIDAYTYGKGATHLLFVGGIHGGYEWNSVLLSYQFMDYLEANPTFIPQNITITVVPSANPDGVFKVIPKEGRFSLSDIPTSTPQVAGTGRFNAHNVDLNRNFDCKWKPQSTWKNKVVSAGTSTFSEPEARAIRDYVLAFKPDLAIFWHSMANSVYASECKTGILPQTLLSMDAYAKASGYNAVKTFDAYAVSGDAEGWLASINIPAITVELKTHETVEWDKNLAGIKALLSLFTKK